MKIAILGFGTVGSGVLKILADQADMIQTRVGEPVVVKTILERDLKKVPAVKGVLVTDKPDAVFQDPEIDVVVEVIGGEIPAKDFICRALENKKVVITSNKEVMAKHKRAFFELAKKYQTPIYYEASVGGGIPLIRALKVGYAANQIQSICGILNGTTNYILTQIEQHHRDFQDVLKQAQALGFAEADPTMDVSGLDVAYKLVILAEAAFKVHIDLKDVFYQGITSIDLKDLVYANELGYAIKLLAFGKRHPNGALSFKVHPTMIPKTHPLAGVHNEFNALFLNGDSVGESMLMGRGAGSLPTASAVVSDVVDFAFCAHCGLKRQVETIQDNPELMPIEETETQFYIRLFVPDTFGILERIAGIFGQNKISISKILQQDVVGTEAELVIVTHQVKEAHMNRAMATLQHCDVVKKVQTVLRVGLEEV